MPGPKESVGLLAPGNPRLKRLRKLISQPRARREEGCFVVDGPILVGEALAAHCNQVTVHEVYAEADYHRGVELVDQARQTGITGFEVVDGSLDRVLQVRSPQPVAAVVSRHESMVEVFNRKGTAILLVDANDPGNVGTVMRSAEAAGMVGIILAGASVDPTNAKVLRASAGAGLRLPIVQLDDLAAALELPPLDSRPLVATAAVGIGGVAVRSHHDVDLRNAIVAIGNEANGLPQWLLEQADTIARIDMAGPTESLNLSVAASLFCFEALRQQRNSLDNTQSE